MSLPKVFEHRHSDIHDSACLAALDPEHFQAHAMLRSCLNILFQKKIKQPGAGLHVPDQFHIDELRTPLYVEPGNTRGIVSDEDVFIQKATLPQRLSVYEMTVPDSSAWPQSGLEGIDEGTYAVTEQVGIKVFADKVEYLQAGAMNKLAIFVMKISLLRNEVDGSLQAAIDPRAATRRRHKLTQNVIPKGNIL